MANLFRAGRLRARSDIPDTTPLHISLSDFASGEGISGPSVQVADRPYWCRGMPPKPDEDPADGDPKNVDCLCNRLALGPGPLPNNEALLNQPCSRLCVRSSRQVGRDGSPTRRSPTVSRQPWEGPYDH